MLTFAATVCRLGDRTIKPQIIAGCDGVHGKVCKIINPDEAERSSRASDWGYYELNLSAEANKHMSEEEFNHFHIWPGKGRYSDEFIVGLPNADRFFCYICSLILRRGEAVEGGTSLRLWCPYSSCLAAQFLFKARTVRGPSVLQI